MPCRIKRSQDWTFRLEKEMDIAMTATFLTLTYADEHITRNDQGFGILVPDDLKQFWWSLRKYQKRHARSSWRIRYYAVGEYGGDTWRPHYHAIVFNMDHKTIENLSTIWNKGFVYTGTVTPQSIGYVTKYITKVDTRNLEEKGLTTQFARMSNRPGIGHNYLTNEQNIEYHNRKNSKLTINKGAYKRPLPTYYTDRLYPREDTAKRTIHDIETDKLRIRTAKYKKARDANLRASGNDPEQYLQELTEQQIRQLNHRNKRNKL